MMDNKGTSSSGVPAPPDNNQAPQYSHQTAYHVPTYTQAQHAAPAYYQPQQQYASANNTREGKGHGVRTFFIAFAGALVACAVALGVFGIFNASQPVDDSSSQTLLGAQDTSTIDAIESDTTLPEAVAKKCLPSVVAIDVFATQSSNPYGNMYGYGLNSQGNTETLTQISLGSGVVLSEDGYIVTNYHVIEGGEAYDVTIEGEQYEAELIGSDPSSDIAVLKAHGASGLTPAEIGDSDDLTIGEWVMTIGSPFGLEQSVATGIVSATSRSQIMDSTSDSYGYGTSSSTPTIYPNMIQTDAAINPGNSGGALVDENGRLIGINTLITSYSGNYSGVGFAIPVNYAVNIAQQIIDGEAPTHAQLGVSLSTVNAQNAQRYGLSVDQGAYVASVSSGSGAEAAGIEEGDIVTAFDGKAVSSASDLMLDVRSKNPGDKVILTINRSGETKDIEVTLGSDGNSESAPTQQNSSSPSILDYLFGGGSSSRQDKAA